MMTIIPSSSSTTTQYYPPIRNWLPKYPFDKYLIHDTIAGITVGVMAIPQSLSYAILAGLPPQFGLYSDLQIAYPILGSSKYLIVGPVAIVSLMSRIAMESLGNGMTEFSETWIATQCFLTLVVGLLQLSAGWRKIGSLLDNVLSETLTSAFSCVAAIIISSTQLTSLVGLPKCQTPQGHGCNMMSTVVYICTNIMSFKLESVLIGFISILVLLGIKRLPVHREGSHFRVVLPQLGPLIVLTMGVTFVWLMGGSVRSLKLVGTIPSGFPTLRWWYWPSELHIWQFVKLFGYSISIALLGFAEAFAIAKTVAKEMDGDVGTLSADHELIALGGCNVFTSIVGGYAVTGSFSRSAINADSGARSPISTAIAALVVAFVLLVLTAPLSLLPMPCVSAIVLVTVTKMIRVHEIVQFVRDWTDNGSKAIYVYMSTFLVGLTLGVEYGLVVGGLIQWWIQYRYPPTYTNVLNGNDEEKR